MNTMFSGKPPSLQELPPHAAHLCLRTERFLLSILGNRARNATFLIALSGGTDSVALLIILHALSPRLGLRLGAAHVNHSLRPEAAGEQDFCRKLCDWFECPFFTTTLDIPALARQTGAGIEESSRNARYAWFASLNFPHTFLAVGHQLDDLAEDLLMRLVRGTGWPALAGMSALVPGRKLVRPLLLTPRAALAELVQGCGLAPMEDASNQSEAYTRNRVRHRLLPLILQENPSFLDTVANLWRLGRLDEEFFSENLAPRLDAARKRAETAPTTTPAPAGTTESGITLDHACLSSLPAALRLRLYKETLAHLGPGQALVSTLLNLDEAWQNRRSGAVFQFPGDKAAVIHRGSIRFSCAKPGGKADFPFPSLTE